MATCTSTAKNGTGSCRGNLFDFLCVVNSRQGVRVDEVLHLFEVVLLNLLQTTARVQHPALEVVADRRVLVKVRVVVVHCQVHTLNSQSKPHVTAIQQHLHAFLYFASS